jgi:hypothetical protein
MTNKNDKQENLSSHVIDNYSGILRYYNEQ